MEETSPGGLEDLPRSIRRFPYRGRDDFVALKTHEASLPNRNDHFLITNISKREFQHDFLNIEDKTFSWKEYSWLSNLLLARMPSEEHGLAVELFDRKVTQALTRWGLDDALDPTGNSEFYLGSSFKNPDKGWRPDSRDYPTVVLEVGVSERPKQLREEAARWLQESVGEVQAVITMKISQYTPDITIQRWVNDNAKTVMKNETRISKSKPTKANPNSTTPVDNGPFTIPFRDFFLRQPTLNSNESDFTITDEELMVMAKKIWRIQNF